MAGLGRKTWTAGEVLQATELQGYIQDQTVMVFGGTAERGSAIPTPSEGMFTYLTDTNALEYYNGSAWAAFSAGGSGGAFSKHFLLMGA